MSGEGAWDFSSKVRESGRCLCRTKARSVLWCGRFYRRGLSPPGIGWPVGGAVTPYMVLAALQETL